MPFAPSPGEQPSRCQAPLVILGGAGALASAHFHLKLVQAMARAGCRLDEHFPEIIHHSRAFSGLGPAGACAPAAAQAALLAAATPYLGSACAIAVPCVSLTPAAWQLCRQVPTSCRVWTPAMCVPATLQGLASAASPPVRSVPPAPAQVGVLCSRSSRAHQVFDLALGRPCQYLDPGLQAELDALIEDLIGCADPSAQQLAQLCQLCLELQQRGADVVVLGCTELSWLAAGCGRAGEGLALPWVKDPLDWMAERCVKAARVGRPDFNLKGVLT